MKFVAPIPEQIVATTMHFLKVPGELCPLTPQGNALLGFQLVLAWVLRRSNFGPSADRLFVSVTKTHTNKKCTFSALWQINAVLSVSVCVCVCVWVCET